MSLQGKKAEEEHVHSSHDTEQNMEGYRTIGEDEEPQTYKNTIYACLACLAVIAIMIFFIVTAVKDYTPSSNVNLDAFKQDFGPFLQSLSFSFDPSYLNQSQALLDKYPNFYLSYLALAMSYQALGQTSDASNYLQQAQSAGDGQDYLSLLPTSDEFQDKYPDQALIQLSDKIWAVPYYYKIDKSQPFSLFEVGYLVMISNGSLLFLNPVPLEPQVLDQLRNATNNISPDFLVEPTKQHYQLLPAAQDQFQSAQSFGVQAQKDYPPTRNFSWTGFLDDNQPLFPDDFTQITLNGQDSDECAFYHKSTKTIFLADLLMDSVVSNSGAKNFVPGSPNNQTTFFNRLYYWTYGSYNSLAVPNYQNSMSLISDPKAFSDSIKQVTSLDVQRILLVNGGLLADQAQASLQTAFQPYIQA